MKAEEIKNLGWYSGERYALVNTETKSMFFTSDTKESCTDALKRMTSKHPMYSKLLLVENPNENYKFMCSECGTGFNTSHVCKPL